MLNFLDGLFANIGKKIKASAKILAVLILISEIIAGLLISTRWTTPGILGVIAGIVVIVASPFVAFLSTVSIYGFGIIVECAEKNLIKEKNDSDKDFSLSDLVLKNKISLKTHLPTFAIIAFIVIIVMILLVVIG